VKDLTRGTLAGLLGVAAMAGVITTLRRTLLTTEQLNAAKTHPEKIVERGAAMAGMEELDDQTRRRLGDLIHFGYGAAWGAVYAVLSRGGAANPVAGGLALAGGLWAFGFNVLMPVLGVQAGPWKWGKREFVFTISAHIAYGLVTAGTLDQLRKRTT
jgi:hypothetical protein